MAAILRVKRNHYDEPSNALVISCKRQKIAENEDPEDVLSITTFAKFAGTVKKQDENVEHIIQTCRKDELQANFKQHRTDSKKILNKIKEATKQSSVENRYKVVNCFRSLDNSNGVNPEKNVMTVVIDVEDSRSIAHKDFVVEGDNYVYDLYYVQSKSNMYLDDEVSIHSFEQELVYDIYRDNDNPEVEWSSEDSNSESYWKNDYPDSDNSEKSINEDDIREAIMNIKLEEESDLSEEDDFVDAVDEADVESYGYRYAKYKARMKKELKEDDDDDDDDDDHSGFSICASEDSDEYNNY